MDCIEKVRAIHSPIRYGFSYRFFFRMVDANEGNIITFIIFVIFVFVTRKGSLLWRLIPKRGRGYIIFFFINLHETNRTSHSRIYRKQIKRNKKKAQQIEKYTGAHNIYLSIYLSIYESIGFITNEQQNIFIFDLCSNIRSTINTYCTKIKYKQTIFRQFSQRIF